MNANGQPSQPVELPEMGEAVRKARANAATRVMEEEQRRQALTGGLTPEEHLERLVKTRAKLLEAHKFKEGDIVMAKEGCNDFNFPQPGYPCIIHKILDEPVVEEKVDITITRYGRHYDMIALVVFNGMALPFHIESDRYEPYKQAV